MCPFSLFHCAGHFPGVPRPHLLTGNQGRRYLKRRDTSAEVLGEVFLWQLTKWPFSWPAPLECGEGLEGGTQSDPSAPGAPSGPEAGGSAMTPALERPGGGALSKIISRVALTCQRNASGQAKQLSEQWPMFPAL